MTRQMVYTLIGHEPLEIRDVVEWATTFERLTDEQRTVGVDKVGDTTISTVFLGVNYRFVGGPPLLFETMTFPDSRLLDRYTTWDEAVQGHARHVADIRAELVGSTPRRIRVEDCRYCAEHGGEMMPPHDASPACESGGYEHCSCDTCF